MTRSEIIAMVCFVRKKFVQNMVRVEECVREKVISDKLRRRGIDGGVQAEPDSTSHRCIETLSVGRVGETPPTLHVSTFLLLIWYCVPMDSGQFSTASLSSPALIVVYLNLMYCCTTVMLSKPNIK